MPRVLESANALTLGTLLSIALTIAPATAQCSVTIPIPPIPGGGSLGAWAGPFDWSGQIGYTSVQCSGGFSVPLDENELGHSIYLPSGPHAGKVLFWHFLDWPISSTPIPGCPELKTTQLWLFDPGSPNTLIKVKDPASFTSNIFCSGQSFRADGKLLVVGGYNGVATAPTETYLFDPWELGVVRFDSTGQPIVNTTSSTWTPLTDMLLPRYYPIVAPLSPIFPAQQGGHLTLGGLRAAATHANYHEWWV